VSIRVRERGEDSLLLEVEDDGPGIAPEDIARLFVELPRRSPASPVQRRFPA
jgi:DNA topoisomerase VI subunit B